MQIKRVLLSFLILLPFVFHAQVKNKQFNITVYDSVFSKGDIIKIPELIWDLSFPISPLAKDSLNLVADFLKKYPALSIEIACHTDSRGEAIPNSQLSNFRAKSIYEYLIKYQGISPSQISYKGYGELYPIISEAAIRKALTLEEKEKLHQINRRTELKVVSVSTSPF
jgi:hypothetical protein